MTLPTAFFSTELFWTGLKWLMILGLWVVFAWGIWREDRTIKKLLHDKANEQDAIKLLHTLHRRRDIQIWVQLSLLLAIVAMSDIRQSAALLPPDFFTPPAPSAPAPLAKEVPEDKYDKALKKGALKGLPFSNITEFNEQNSKREAYIDWLKEHYESWLVTYYYLQKCQKTSVDDYEIIHQSLKKELDSAHAEATVESNILQAAKGSFKEMYNDIPCDGAHLAGTESMYDANMQQLKSAQQVDKTSQEHALPAGNGSRH